MSKNELNKTPTNFSVDKELKKEFTEVARRLAVNKSALIELYIQQGVKDNRDRKTA